jgi:alkylation response protein AidB-like acyl-CoA dehydrogenase
MWAGSSALLVAPFTVDGGVALFAIPLPTDGVSIEPEVSVDGTRRTARVVFDGARVASSARLDGEGAAALATLHMRGYVMLAAEMIGAAEAMLSRTREYAIERKQFNRQIGSVQAVKHPIVDVMIAIERARSLVVGAAAALDQAPDRAENTARMAKAAATDALRFAVDRGVQLHGGYGFTWDCDAHFFFKRYLWSAATLGDATHHRKHLASALIG